MYAGFIEKLKLEINKGLPTGRRKNGWHLWEETNRYTGRKT